MCSGPLPILLLRLIAALQLAALAVGAVAAAIYVHRSGGATEDAQFTRAGYVLAVALTLLCIVLLGFGLGRMGTGPGRGRVLLSIAQGDIFVGAAGTSQALANPHGPDPIASNLLIWLCLSTVVAAVLMLLPTARAWWTAPAGSGQRGGQIVH
jgi:hypothetical protein